MKISWITVLRSVQIVSFHIIKKIFIIILDIMVHHSISVDEVSGSLHVNIENIQYLFSFNIFTWVQLYLE